MAVWPLQRGCFISDWIAPCGALVSLPVSIRPEKPIGPRPSVQVLPPAGPMYRFLAWSSAYCWENALSRTLGAGAPNDSHIWIYFIHLKHIEPATPPTTKPVFCFFYCLALSIGRARKWGDFIAEISLGGKWIRFLEFISCMLFVWSEGIVCLFFPCDFLSCLRKLASSFVLKLCYENFNFSLVMFFHCFSLLHS